MEDQPESVWSATSVRRILTLCTGNAARSVMAAYMLGVLAQTQGVALEVRSAGTFAIDGQPMSRRTRLAITSLEELGVVDLASHRSRQLRAVDLDGVDLVVAMEADHVGYVRREHPESASKTATITRLCTSLPSGSSPLGRRVATLGLDGVDLDQTVDVPDPAGGEDATYQECARTLMGLCQELVLRL